MPRISPVVRLVCASLIVTLAAACAPTPPPPTIAPPTPPPALTPLPAVTPPPAPTRPLPAKPTEALPPTTPTEAAPPATPTAPTPTIAPALTTAPATVTPAPTEVILQRPAKLQLGLNFIRFYWSPRGQGADTTTPNLQPDFIFRDFKTLGAQAYRQFVQADLFWDVVEPRDNAWNFAQADAVITNAEFEPLVTLFRMQYASATPPWTTRPEEFQKTLGPEALDYLTTVVRRYAPYVKYWELGNEMPYWRAGDPGSNPGKELQNEEALPPYAPVDGFSPQEQGVFLAQVAAIIRQNDPDAVIVAPALPALGDYELNTWLPGVLAGAGGSDWFDIVNYHYYGGWEMFTRQRPQLTETLRKLGLAGKPVWQTETGVTARAELNIRTDYPNSPETQAAEVFRRIVQSWGHGDAFVGWHTYLDSNDTDGNWAAYGLLSQRGAARPAYAAFKLLAEELVPFATVEKLSADPRGLSAYKITTDAGAVKYVVWGQGRYPRPAGVTQMTSVLPDAAAGGGYTWQPAAESLTLSVYPTLLK